MPDPTAPERLDPFAEFRPLWAELDENQKACAAALAADDWEAWAEHAGRGAEIFEKLARLSGWRDGATRMPDPTAPERCRSWRIRGWRIARCTWPRGHDAGSKWHCAEKTKGQPAWPVKGW